MHPRNDVLLRKSYTSARLFLAPWVYTLCGYRCREKISLGLGFAPPGWSGHIKINIHRLLVKEPQSCGGAAARAAWSRQRTQKRPRQRGHRRPRPCSGSSASATPRRCIRMGPAASRPFWTGPRPRAAGRLPSGRSPDTTLCVLRNLVGRSFIWRTTTAPSARAGRRRRASRASLQNAERGRQSQRGRQAQRGRRLCALGDPGQSHSRY